MDRDLVMTVLSCGFKYLNGYSFYLDRIVMLVIIDKVMDNSNIWIEYVTIRYIYTHYIYIYIFDEIR